MEATTEWKIGGLGVGGGREHTCHSLWTGDKCTQPKFPSFVWDWEGKQQCFFLPEQTTGDFTCVYFDLQWRILDFLKGGLFVNFT